MVPAASGALTAGFASATSFGASAGFVAGAGLAGSGAFGADSGALLLVADLASVLSPRFTATGGSSGLPSFSGGAGGAALRGLPHRALAVRERSADATGDGVSAEATSSRSARTPRPTSIPSMNATTGPLSRP